MLSVFYNLGYVFLLKLQFFTFHKLQYVHAVHYSAGTMSQTVNSKITGTLHENGHKCGQILYKTYIIII